MNLPAKSPKKTTLSRQQQLLPAHPLARRFFRYFYHIWGYISSTVANIITQHLAEWKTNNLERELTILNVTVRTQEVA